MVTKVTNPQDSWFGDECIIDVKPVPVPCVCSFMWCFKCQEDAHWPATCEEASILRKKNAAYSGLMTSTVKKKRLITSVQVKHCPFCLYPVEIGLGCDHMTCILCFKEFCCVCLGKWSCLHHLQQCCEHTQSKPAI